VSTYAADSAAAAPAPAAAAPAAAAAAADTLSALADPTRRTIFERIADRPSGVTQLADKLPVSRPAVSQHLKVLKDAGLVTDRKEGTRRIYTLDPSGLEQLRAYLDEFWHRSLAAFKEAAEQRAQEDA
jgi:DNA-binding transcriptional ArsR family regulator